MAGVAAGGQRRPAVTAVDPGALSRAEAARALARIALDGVSLRNAFDARASRSIDPRDRALLSATLFESSRWWLRYDAALAQLMESPLPPKAREIRSLLVLGFVQIDVLGMPDYAVVAACVDAARLLGQPRFAGLVNAVLRRFLRERDALKFHLDADPVTRLAHPRWLIDRVAADWPNDSTTILEANNREASLTLRVNRRRSDRQSVLALLHAAGINASAPDDLPDALVLAHSTDVSRLPGFADGLFSVQDGAAQRVVDLLQLADGLRVLDACAAPGGKTAHMLERASVDVVALDNDPARLPRLRESLSRLGLNADVRHGDATKTVEWWDGRVFDRILVDAPCSATGIIRRQPDIKLHRRASDIGALVSTQARLLDAAWPMLAPGGLLIYATCSVLRVENEGALTPLLDRQTDTSVRALPDALGREAGVGRQNLPGCGGMDGFFYAVVEKNSR
ncbi:MAG: 16S rRNA (cytosine(967)-C(5))-methyltransferase RsmB [Dokdonella sp.]